MPFVNSRQPGTQMAFPDVCKTPSQTPSVPMPYPNPARSAADPKKPTKVFMSGKALSSKVTGIQGDQAA